jgi:hypothetical protein
MAWNLRLSRVGKMPLGNHLYSSLFARIDSRGGTALHTAISGGTLELGNGASFVDPIIAPDVTAIIAPLNYIAYSKQARQSGRGPERQIYFSDEEERTIRNQETTILLDSNSMQNAFYNAGIFDVADLDDARRIILTPENDRTRRNAGILKPRQSSRHD